MLYGTVADICTAVHVAHHIMVPWWQVFTQHGGMVRCTRLERVRGRQRLLIREPYSGSACARIDRFVQLGRG